MTDTQGGSPSPQLKRAVKRAVAKWQKKLRLSHWTISVKYVDEMTDAYMRVTPDERRQQAVVTVGSDVVEGAVHDWYGVMKVDDMVLHELLHLHEYESGADVRKLAALSLAKRRVPVAVLKQMHGLLNEGHEAIIHRMTTVIKRLEEADNG